ncbi:MAG: nicotinate-nucleotide adenylyltransferase [Zoogloeaceae bacterium]|nr:nicotinate-nucleotide adenylyltransferase [Zoogloeaceae bacterium]
MPRLPAEAAPLGLFGGTFDPIHLGHLRLAEEARESLGLASVCFIPAGTPPHRDVPQTPAEHRLEMVRRAVSGNPAFSCDDAEVRSEGRSYTVLTLERLRAQHGDRPLVLLLGADAFLGLAGWHRWQEIVRLAHIAVAGRPGHAADELPAELRDLLGHRISHDAGRLRAAPAGAIVRFDMTPLAISATEIRAMLHNGRSPRYLLPDSVVDYIAAHSLYGYP